MRRESTDAQFYIERLGADFSDYMEEDRRYRLSVRPAQQQLGQLGRVQTIDREHVPEFYLWRSGYRGRSWTGWACSQYPQVCDRATAHWCESGSDAVGRGIIPFTVEDLSFIVPDVIRKQRTLKEVTLAKVELNDGQYLYGVNDLFIGRKTHVSARYEVRLGTSTEQQSSSGIIVSTGMGSTGWFKSVLAGATGIVGSAAWQNMNSEVEVATASASIHGSRQELNHFNWDAPYLYFSVREPFPSRTTAANLVFGQIHSKQPLHIVSQMPEDGVIFSDGVEQDFLEFNSGVEAIIGLAEKRGRLVV